MFIIAGKSAVHEITIHQQTKCFNTQVVSETDLL